MKVLSCHNYYQQRGGEDQSFEDEVALLRDHGDEVVTYTRHNDDIDAMSKFSVAKQTFWSRRAASDIRRLLSEHRPDVMHCTNTFPLISPSVYREAKRAGVPVVQSLRNYRMACLNACFHREQQVCEDCLGKAIPWQGIRRRCYRGSLAGSLVVAGMQVMHRQLGTWRLGVDAFYTLTQFAREKCLESGLPADRVHVKSNCVQPDPRPGAGQGGYAVFVGRLTPEKGVATMIDAWRQLGEPYTLKIIGGGPLEEQAATAAAECANIEWLGPLPHAELLEVIGEARALIMPSEWYETFGRTIIEAYAKATPVIASRLGAMAELVQEDQTGLLFSPGDASDLVAAVRKLWALPAEQAAALRDRCRAEYLGRYTPSANYQRLREIYSIAINHHREAVATNAEPSSPAPTGTPVGAPPR